MRHRSFALIALAAVISPAAFPQGHPDARPVVRATGEASVTATPDRATVQIGVVTQSASAQAAAAANAKELESVLAQLRKALGPTGELKTVAYSVNPNYRYQPNAAPVITGYTASNTIQLITDDLSRLGRIIDAASQAGANNIQSLQFGLKDENPVRAQALREAARQARANAEAMAAALNLKVVRVLEVIESGGGPRPVREAMFAKAAAMAVPSTPVEAGTVEVRATVSVALEVAQ